MRLKYQLHAQLQTCTFFRTHRTVLDAAFAGGVGIIQRRVPISFVCNLRLFVTLAGYDSNCVWLTKQQEPQKQQKLWNNCGNGECNEFVRLRKPTQTVQKRPFWFITLVFFLQ